MTSVFYLVYLDVKENGIVYEDYNRDDFTELNKITKRHSWKSFEAAKKVALDILERGGEVLNGEVLAVRVVEVVDDGDDWETECVWDSKDGDL